MQERVRILGDFLQGGSLPAIAITPGMKRTVPRIFSVHTLHLLISAQVA